MQCLHFISQSPEATRRLGACLGQVISPPNCLVLEGEMGAGKTVFVQGLAAGLGCAPAEISSPTFALAIEHPSIQKAPWELVHMDAWRLEDAAAFSEAGLDAYLAQAHTVVAIEWGSRVMAALPADCLYFSSRPLQSDEQALLEASGYTFHPQSRLLSLQLPEDIALSLQSKQDTDCVDVTAFWATRATGAKRQAPDNAGGDEVGRSELSTPEAEGKRIAPTARGQEPKEGQTLGVPSATRRAGERQPCLAYSRTEIESYPADQAVASGLIQEADCPGLRDKLLILDSSFPRCQVLLLSEEKYYVVQAPAGSRASQHLQEMLHALLEKACLSLQDIQHLAVTRGPGSFTGMRLGMAMSQGLALALEKEVWPLSTLAALAHSVLADWGSTLEGAWIYSLIDARNERAYGALYQVQQGQLKMLLPESVDAWQSSSKALIQTLEAKGKKGSELVLVGPGAAAFASQENFMGVLEALPVAVHIREQEMPTAEGLLGAWRQALATEAPCDPAYLRPAYLNLTQAERERGLDVSDSPMHLDSQV